MTAEPSVPETSSDRCAAPSGPEWPMGSVAAASLPEVVAPPCCRGRRIVV